MSFKTDFEIMTKICKSAIVPLISEQICFLYFRKKETKQLICAFNINSVKDVKTLAK